MDIRHGSNGAGEGGARPLARASAVLLLAVTMLAAGWGVGEAAAKVRVVATLSGLADLTRVVGGERVEVTALCQGYQDAHYLEPKPSYARKLRKADLLVYSGLELEVGWLPPLLDTARNPKLRPGSNGLLEAAHALEHVLEVPDTPQDRSQGDVHPFGNPHFLTDPRQGLQVAEAIARRLRVLDPEGGTYYEERLTIYREKLKRRIADWERRAAPLRGIPIACYHREWPYLVDWLGLEVVGYIENRPGIPPSPRHVDELIGRLSEAEVRFIMCSTFSDVEATEEVARRAGTRAVILPAGVNGVEEADTYEHLIDLIVARLLEAAEVEDPAAGGDDPQRARARHRDHGRSSSERGKS